MRVKIEMIATIEVPKGGLRAFERGVAIAQAMEDAKEAFKIAGCEHPTFITGYMDEETPPPADPLRRRGGRRSAQPPTASAPPGNGPSAPADAPPPDAPAVTSPASAAGEGDPTRDGLAPEAGADPGDPPAFLRRSA